ncbi:hypothetical protein ACFL43_05550, partial [Thermodesulfobacteriota bacterium]
FMGIYKALDMLDNPDLESLYHSIKGSKYYEEKKRKDIEKKEAEISSPEYKDRILRLQKYVDYVDGEWAHGHKWDHARWAKELKKNPKVGLSKIDDIETADLRAALKKLAEEKYPDRLRGRR